MPQIIADNLEADGYRPVCAAVTATALGLLSATLDALIVDVNGDTLGVIDAIRDQVRPDIDPDLPILVLTSHTGELHRTRLLDTSGTQHTPRHARSSAQASSGPLEATSTTLVTC